ncbi:hypothetical protein N0V90_009851 [Kalmusia sp. IMI 367209]|nr:hypothetical protein N0V90_009851 [Kalmusia sp. IMI 367209]
MSCELSPSAAAFSSMLSAFVGSVLNGLFSGFWIAFFTGWISWLSVIRIVAAGLYEFYLTIKAGTNFTAVDEKKYQSIGLNMYGGANRVPAGAPADEEERLTQEMNAAQEHLAANYHPAFAAQFQQQRNIGGSLFSRIFKQPERTVSVFGWLGWAWSAIYTPISQSIWLAVHITDSDGALQLVRALAIGVSALGLTFDYKQRYGAAAAKKWGSWAFVVFNVWNASACLLLGVEAIALLIHGALNVSFTPVPLLVAYPIFSIIWAWASWRYLPPIDGARPGMNIFADVLMGAFAGIFVAGPAFGLWQSRKFDDETAAMTANFWGESSASSTGLSLGDYLNCQGASVLEKFAAIMP